MKKEVEKKKITDKWIQEDKFHHVCYSMGMVGLSYHLLDCRWEVENAKLIAIGGTFTLGIIKEIYDKYKRKTGFNTKDIICNTVGIGLGVLVFLW